MLTMVFFWRDTTRVFLSCSSFMQSCFSPFERGFGSELLTERGSEKHFCLLGLVAQLACPSVDGFVLCLEACGFFGACVLVLPVAYGRGFLSPGGGFSCFRLRDEGTA